MRLNYRAKGFFWLVLLSGISLSIMSLSRFTLSATSLIALTLFAPLAFLAEVYEVEVIYRQSVSVATPIYLGAVFIGGAPLAMAVALPAVLLSEAIIRWESRPEDSPLSALFQKLAFNLSQILISIYVATAVFNLTGGTSPPFSSVQHYIPPLLAFMAFTLTNASLVTGIISLTEKVNFLRQIKFHLEKLLVQTLSMGVLSILIAVLYGSSPWNALLIAVLLTLVNISLRNYMHLRRDAKNTFEKMTELLSKRDPYTAEHSEVVADLSEAIAVQLGMREKEVERIVSAARVHDIGKIAIPDEVLLKPGELTSEEWKVMEEHPEIGADILGGLEIYEGAVEIVRHEHERWDGTGYPDGLEGEDIPMGARVVAAADIWNALTTERPYRGPLPHEEAVEMMQDIKGEELDPEVTEALLKVVSN
ncbi:MAG: HD-GYP domain-containing protein [Candidatus Bipolaricaulota bacterium]